MQRAQLIAQIAEPILALSNPRVLFVAIDGVDGAGKTTFADELAAVLATSARPIIRASVDSFHNPRAARYRQGRSSPRGFFEDSYDYAKLREYLLAPLSPGGTLRFRRAAFDVDRDTPVVASEELAPLGSILVLDGIFLHRESLRRYWNFSVLLEVGFEISIPRGAQRGAGSPDPRAPSNRRYVQGQEIYLEECNPREHATLVVNNEDLEEPRIVT